MTRKQTNPLAFAVASVVALLGGAGVAYWQWGVVGELSTEAQTRRVEVGSKTELERQLQQTNLDLQEANSKINHLESTVTTIEYVPTLLQDLQKTGESCNLKIIGVRPVPRVDNKAKKVGDGSEDKVEKPVRKPYEELDVEVKSRGSFMELLTFLKRLEVFPKIVGVRQMSLVPKAGLDGKTLDEIEASFRIRVYVFPTAKAKNGTPSNVSTQAVPAGGAQ